MKSLFSLFFLSCICALNSFAQINKEDTISVPQGCIITSDNLENVYVITPTNDIIKYNKLGIKVATANFKVLGDIASVDASNPFEIYVFYRDQNKIIFLDNLLNLRGECDLENIGVSQVACLTRSSDNQIWLFDVSDQKLKKYSKDLKLMIESAASNTFNVGDLINPINILDVNSKVLMINNLSVLEFDLYGNFNKTLLYDTFKTFQFLKGKLVFLKNNSIYIYDPNLFKMEILNQTIPIGTKSVRIEKERLFILKDESLILRTISE